MLESGIEDESVGPLAAEWIENFSNWCPSRLRTNQKATYQHFLKVFCCIKL